MTLRCDHCRHTLGPTVRRYWQMRFCSPACIAAYQRRLDDVTRTKIGRLEGGVRRQPGRRVTDLTRPLGVRLAG